MAATQDMLRRGAPDRLPRRARRPLTLGHAAPFVFALLAFVAALAALRNRSQTVLVPVAASTINVGAPVDTAAVRLVSMHAGDTTLRSGIVAAGQLGPSSGWVAAVLIHAGDPITQSEIVKPSGPAGLGAMSLQVPMAHADGGALVAGDRVDVIAQAGGAAQYVARGLQVLGVAPKETSSLSSSSPAGYYVTVAVDAPTALALSQALSAQSSSAVDVVRTTGVANDQLSKTVTP